MPLPRCWRATSAIKRLLIAHDQIDVRAVLPQIRRPTLVTQRRGDHVVTCANDRFLADHAPEAQYLELPGADHFAPEGDSDAVVDAIVQLVHARPAPAAQTQAQRWLATVLFTDIVARAIDFEMKKHGLDFVWLDATALGEAFLKEHFPTIHARCLLLGIDIARQPIPVVPAAHYTCGGVVTDLHGRTDLPGLYAVGETSYTGLHGANRLASNSLLECVVLGHACAAHIAAQPPPDMRSVPPWDESQVEDADEQVVIAHNWDELRLLMWNYVGIVRTTKRLERALHRIKLLRDEIEEYYANFRVIRDLLELRNLVVCAELIVRSALHRHESRGLHFNRDFPHTLPVSFPTVLTRRARSR